MPDYVLVYHECPEDYIRSSHWDLMLERDGVLWTWAIDRLPAGWARELGIPDPSAALDDGPMIVERLDDHRLAYLDFEGDIRGGRGMVRRYCRGHCDWVLAIEDRIVVRLGSPLSGTLTLDRIGLVDPHWQLVWR
ncbi:MAG: hypothetical protein JW829_10075 [Pirellulales bacterium]|nr:hypothetical protein [Pirellulales bacterium]